MSPTNHTHGLWTVLHPITIQMRLPKDDEFQTRRHHNSDACTAAESGEVVNEGRKVQVEE